MLRRLVITITESPPVLVAMLLTMVLAALIGATAFASQPNMAPMPISHKKNNRAKTVHVRSYKKKNGTVVRAYEPLIPR
jgi:hypothetical protein